MTAIVLMGTVMTCGGAPQAKNVLISDGVSISPSADFGVSGSHDYTNRTSAIQNYRFVLPLHLWS